MEPSRKTSAKEANAAPIGFQFKYAAFFIPWIQTRCAAIKSISRRGMNRGHDFLEILPVMQGKFVQEGKRSASKKPILVSNGKQSNFQ